MCGRRLSLSFQDLGLPGRCCPALSCTSHLPVLLCPCSGAWPWPWTPSWRYLTDVWPRGAFCSTCLRPCGCPRLPFSSAHTSQCPRAPHPEATPKTQVSRRSQTSLPCYAPHEPFVAFLSSDPLLSLPDIMSFLLAKDARPSWCLQALHLPPWVTVFPGSLPREPCPPQPVPWQGARHAVPAHLPAFRGSRDLTLGTEPDRRRPPPLPQPERREAAI